MKKKFITILCCCAAVVTALSGCGNQAPQAEAAGSETAEEVQDSDETGTNTEEENKKSIICYVGHGFWESSMDPLKGAYAYGYDFINNALICVGTDSKYKDDLASSWEISEDALSYTFHLKEGIKFHDGSDFTAEDVVFTYETVKQNQGNNESVDLTKLEKIEAPDGQTVVFTLSEAYSPFLDTTAQLGIVPSDSYDDIAFDETPIGTGPWKVVQYDAEQQLIVEANTGYFDGAPSIERVTFVDMDNETAFSNANSGQLDVVMVQPNYAEETVEGMHIERLATMDIRNISLPCRPVQTIKDPEGNEIEIGNDVTSDVEVRKALSIGINREQIIENAFNGVGKPAYGFTDNLEWGNALKVQDAQAEEAKAILENAGWVDSGEGIREKDGQKCEFEVYTPASEQDRYNLAAAVAEDAKQLGISIIVKQASWDEVTEASHQAGVVWGYGQFSPTVIQQLLISDNFMNDAYANTQGYENSRVDSLIDEALKLADHDEVVAKWKEIQSESAAEYPYLYLVNIEHCYFVSDNLDISAETQIPHPHGHGIPIICNMKDWTIK